MNYPVDVIQEALRERGFKGANGRPLVVDGIHGKNTSHAIIAFKVSVGLRARDYVGPITFAMLTQDGEEIGQSIPDSGDPEWFDHMLKYLGKNENKHNAEVKAWLRSDGATVGDPSKIPWCGDAVETSIRNTLPGIVVPANPYAAVNWTKWHKYVAPQRGSILVFHRGDESDWRGHVGFYAGESDSNYYVLGGNQSNSVTISPMPKWKLRSNGSRWPDHKDAPEPTGRTVKMSGGSTVSVT